MKLYERFDIGNKDNWGAFLDFTKSAKETSVDTYICWLESVGDGANIHTRNKAVLYLRAFENSDALRFKYGQNFDRLGDLKISVQAARMFGDWDELTDHMAGWW